MENITGEIVFDAQRIREAKEEARQRIFADKARVSEAVWPILDHIAEHLFDGTFDSMSLRSAQMPDGKPPKRANLDEFSSQLGVTVAPYIKDQRMLTATRLLETTGLEIQDIAEIVCGVRPSAFSSDFRKWDEKGRTPAGYRAAEGDRAYSKRDWLRAWLWFWIGVVTEEQLDMMLAAERAQSGSKELDAEFGELWVEGIEAFLADRGRELTLAACRKHRCGTGDVFEALSRRSREEGRTNRQKGVDLAEMALAVVEGSLEVLGSRGADYLALGWARLGNARRLASDLEGAEVAIQRAESWVVEAVEEDRVLAEVLYFKSLLRLFQRRFTGALTFVDEAVALSQVAGDNLLLIDALHQRACVYLYQAQVAEAMPDLHRALRLLPSDDKRRRMGALQHLLGAAVLAEDKDRVDELLPEARRLCAEAGHRPSELQTLWLEGWLLRERGEFEAAEPLLKEARAGFSQIDDVGMMAICSLELALLYRAQGDEQARVMTYAADALPALEALDLLEALGAISLLREAIGDGEITRPVLDLARRRLLMPYLPEARPSRS